jgi:catalase
MAGFLAGVGKQTEVSWRFSIAPGELARRAGREVRGFALKFHPDEGNRDSVGNPMPVLQVHDSMKSLDLVHSRKRHPKTNLRRRNWHVESIIGLPVFLAKALPN